MGRSPSATLRGGAAHTVLQALNTAIGTYDGDDARTPAEQRADALDTIARFFLDNNANEQRAGRNRPHVAIVVPYESIVAEAPGGAWRSGAPATPEEVREALCDCALNRMVTRGESVVIDYGRTTRSVPQSLYDVVEARDQRCRAPGCDRPPSWCHAHHLWHWADGGPTNQGNLALLCGAHHRLAHRERWRMELADDGTLTITLPDGTVRTTHPPSALRFTAA